MNITDKISAARLGANLYRIMCEREMTQCELADRCGLSQPTVSKIINGRNGTRLETIRKLCDGLGCTLADLFDGVSWARP